MTLNRQTRRWITDKKSDLLLPLLGKNETYPNLLLKQPACFEYSRLNELSQLKPCDLCHLIPVLGIRRQHFYPPQDRLYPSQVHVIDFLFLEIETVHSQNLNQHGHDTDAQI